MFFASAVQIRIRLLLYITSPEDKMAARPTKSPVFRDSTNRDTEPYSLSQSLQRQPEEVRLRPWHHGTTWEQLWSYDQMWKLIKWSNSIQFLHFFAKTFPTFSLVQCLVQRLVRLHFQSVPSLMRLCDKDPWLSEFPSASLAQPTLTQLTQLTQLISQLSIKLQVTALNLARPVGARILYLKRLATSPIFRTDCFWQMARQMGLSENRVPHIMSYFDFLIVELAILGYPGILYFWINGNTKMEDAKHEHGKQPKQ